jgi:hypothetical protein
MEKDCSIIVSSCDNFSDVWEAFFTLFFRYWPNCPFKIYLISETKVYPDERITTISLGEDKKWASNIKLTLQKIDTPYVIYFQEDYLLRSSVDTGRITGLLDFAIKNNAGCLRLFPAPKPDKKLPDSPGLGEITKGKLYSVSLQAAIWKKEVFEALLADGETGWNMEIDGSKRSADIKEPFLSVYDKALDYPDATAVKKGKWLYDAVKLCEKEGIKIDETKRKVETRIRYFLRISKLPRILNRFKNLLSRPVRIL